MSSRLGVWGVRIGALACSAVLAVTPAEAAAPYCYPKTIGPFPFKATATFQVTEAFVLNSCFDSDGDTLHATSPYGLPYTIYISPTGESPTGPYVHNVTDGKGNWTTQTIYITRGGGY